MRTHCHGSKLQNYKRKGILYCHSCHMHYDYSGQAIGIHGIRGVFTKEDAKAYYAAEAARYAPFVETLTPQGKRFTREAP